VSEQPKRLIARASEAQGLHDGTLTEIRRAIKPNVKHVFGRPVAPFSEGSLVWVAEPSLYYSRKRDSRTTLRIESVRVERTGDVWDFVYTVGRVSDAR
jgi:hypothetical protein